MFDRRGGGGGHRSSQMFGRGEPRSGYDRRGGGDYRYGGRDFSQQRHEEDAEGYVSYSDKIQRLTYADIDCDDVTIDALDDSSRRMLQKGGIKELFPVQKAAYRLFVDGRELIVKSKTGSGKTLAFLLPLQ